MRLFFICFSVLTLVSCDSSRTRGSGGSGEGDAGGVGGGGNGDAGGSNGTGCTGQACYQKDCGPGRPRTSVSGRVTAPNGLDPIYDAAVYVPYGIPEFPQTIECETCNDPVGGRPIVTVQTNVDGTFTLSDVPVTAQVPIVVQKGRFRKITYLTPTECADTPLTAVQARLPRNQSEGTLPRMAVGVGSYDQIECVLRSFGIDDSEFTAPSGMGAVHLYHNGGGLGGFGAASFEALLADGNKLRDYNLLFVNCTSNQWAQLGDKPLIALNLHNYVNSGGRLYTTDWSYDYLEQVMQFSPYVYFEGGGSMTAPQPAHAASTASNAADFPAKVMDPTLAAWLRQTGVAINGNDEVTIEDLLASWTLVKDVSANQTSYPSQVWVRGNTNGADRPLTVTFDYNMCGKALFSSYHTREPGGGALINPFPAYCKSTPTTMIAQEKILMYLLLQISSCVGPIG